MSDDSHVERARLDVSTRLAYERTFLAHENTQMAWLRTALSLISFGFGIAKFFETLHEKLGEQAPLLSARDVGILMIATGVAASVAGSLQHRRAMKRLHEQCPDLPTSSAGVIAAFVGALGLLALAGALIR